MSSAKQDPVVLPDVFDPTTPLSSLIPQPANDLTQQQPQPSPDTGQRQPQKQPQTDPLEDKDVDIGGGD